MNKAEKQLAFEAAAKAIIKEAANDHGVFLHSVMINGSTFEFNTTGKEKRIQ